MMKLFYNIMSKDYDLYQLLFNDERAHIMTKIIIPI